MKKISLLAGGMIAAIVLTLPSCSSSEAGAEYDLLPVKLSKDGKWSMIDKSGTVVYDAEFSSEPTVALDGHFVVKTEDGYTVFAMGDKTPKEVPGLTGLKYAGYMQDGLIPVTKENKRIEIADDKGKTKFELAPVKGLEVVSCAPGFSEGLLAFKTEENRYGYYDASGKVAVDPKYTTAYSFAEGVAVVCETLESKDAETGNTSYKNEYSVIDKSGKTQFKIKEKYTNIENAFKSGYLLVKDDEGRSYLLNKKGEETRLPEKVKSVEDYNGKYIIFRGDERSYGVMTFDGEVKIRAKYDKMVFDGEDGFIVKKDDECEILDSDGEVKQTLDYKNVMPLPGYGYVGVDGSTGVLLDKDFKPKMKDDIYDLGMKTTLVSELETDYYDFNVVSASVINLAGEVMGKYPLGSLPSKVFAGEDPSGYEYHSGQVEMKSLSKENLFMNASVYLIFNREAAIWENGAWSWNPEAKEFVVSVRFMAKKEISDDDMQKMVKAVEGQGYKQIAKHVSEEMFYVVFKKGTVLAALVKSNNSGALSYVSDPDGEQEKEAKAFVAQKNGETVEEVADTVVAE